MMQSYNAIGNDPIAVGAKVYCNPESLIYSGVQNELRKADGSVIIDYEWEKRLLGNQKPFLFVK